MESSDVQNPSFFRVPIYISPVQRSECIGIFSDVTNKAWMITDNHLAIIDTNNGQCIKKWMCNYGEIYNITEVVYGTNHFLVVSAKLFSEVEAYVIVLMNNSSLTVIKVIYFSEKVTSISSLDIRGLSTVNSLLQHFDGILVVGCQGGSVYLVNLGLSHSLNEEPVHPLPIKIINDYRMKDFLEESWTAEYGALQLLKGKVIYLLATACTLSLLM